MTLAAEIEIANFPEASSAVSDGPYDLSLVEGSITTAHDAERIHKVREQSKFLSSRRFDRPVYPWQETLRPIPGVAAFGLERCK